MPTLDIEGIGRVEVDDSFLSLSPAEQERTIDNIATSASRTRPQTTQTVAPAPPAPSGLPATPTSASGSTIQPDNPQPDPETWAGDAFLQGLKSLGISGQSEQALFDYMTTEPNPSPEGLAAFSREYGAEIGDPAAALALFQGSGIQPGMGLSSPGSPLSVDVASDPEPKPKLSNRAEAALIGAGDAVTLGFLDEIGAGAQAAIPDLGRTSVWDGKSWEEAYGENLDANRRVLDLVRDEHPVSSAAGGIAGGLLPVGTAFNAARAQTALGKLGAATGAGAAYGAAYGFGSDEGGLADRADGAAFGGVAGAAGGAALSAAAPMASRYLSPLVQRVAPKLAQRKFEAEQARNPFVMADAEVASDVD